MTNLPEALLIEDEDDHKAFCHMAEILYEHCARMTPDTAQAAAEALASLPPELKLALRALLDDTTAELQ